MDALVSIFAEVRDPRDSNARHDLPAMLFIAVAAMLTGAKSCVDIADFAEANEAELAEIVSLPHGAPSHDSFSRILRLLDPEELIQAFARFASTLREALGLDHPKGVVAIDGKRLRRGYERGKVHMPPLLVSVWDAETRLSIAAALAPPGAHAGNEVAATLAALKSLSLKGCILTADALHGHPAMARAVLDRGADYALKIKSNNKPLHDCAIAAFKADDAIGKLLPYDQVETGHDRTERRSASIVARPADAPDFPGLVAFGRIATQRRPTHGKLSRDVHYIALSKRVSPKRLIEIGRAHWSVENHLHRTLDVVFFEDDARTRKNHAPVNLGIIRRIALDMLRAHPDKRSVARKMNLARWKEGFFYELFTHMR